MFSTTDTLSARYCKVYLLTEDEVVPAAVPQWLRSHAEKLQAEPMLDRLDYLADRLAQQTWVEEGKLQREKLAPFLSDSDTTPPTSARYATALDRHMQAGSAKNRLQVSKVRLELWKANYDEAGPQSLSGRLMLSVTRKVLPE